MSETKNKASEEMNRGGINMRKGKNIMVLVGPSGSGKTSIGRNLEQQGIPKLITATTRSIRSHEGEVDGRDYHFRTKEEMAKMELICPTEMKGNWYGLPVEEIENKLEEYGTVHVVLDNRGAEEMKKRFPEETCIFYIPVSVETMTERMRQRGDSQENIRIALDNAVNKQELVAPKVTHYILKNDGKEGEAVKSLLCIFGITASSSHETVTV